MIETVHLFPILDAKLIELLRSLSPEDWNKPTLAKLWTVKDIAAHLLDGNTRTICLSRDAQPLVPDREINSYQSLVDYLNHLNAEWVKAFKRVSPPVLTDWLESSGKEYSAYIATLNPEDNAQFSVAWAGEEVSKNWFHIAREYTEKFHHQQQIREAVNKPGLMTKELFYPFIDTLMHGQPHAFRNTKAENGTIIQLTVDTEIGGDWFLNFENDKWTLIKNHQGDVAGRLIMSPDVAWKTFTKAYSPQYAIENSKFEGNKELLLPALGLIAIMG